MGAQRGLHRYTDGERMISQDIHRAPDAAPGELADALIRTLEIERSVLEELDSDFQLQREAISRRDFETIEDATHRTNESVTRRSEERRVGKEGRETWMESHDEGCTLR